jgi:hypothetical protein
MIGLLLIYFVGKYFYDLAGQHNKSKWGFAILGIISYYVGTFIGGIVIALMFEFFLETSLDDFSEIVLGIMAIPMGVLACWGFYKVLENLWSKTPTSNTTDVLDQDLVQRD